MSLEKYSPNEVSVQAEILGVYWHELHNQELAGPHQGMFMFKSWKIEERNMRKPDS